MNNTILIGADPECFVQQGLTISHCIGLLGGDKDNPRKVEFGAVQEDNVLFEFNVDPCASSDELVHHVHAVMDQGADLLDSYGLRFKRNTSSHVYPSLEGFPERAFEFGCTPDYNALTNGENPRPSATEQNLRTAGGHVHIGFNCDVTPMLQREVIIACDYLLGLPSLLEDKDTRRRELYGKAGACRYKPYGVEYRTLSNYWIWDDELIAKIYDRAVAAFELARDAARFNNLKALITPEEVQAVINTGDVAKAKAYLEIISHASK
jgi:hypothetical protein